MSETTRILTATDVAKRLGTSAFRTLSILMDVRQAEGTLWVDVMAAAPHDAGLLVMLRDELQTWIEGVPGDMPESIRRPNVIANPNEVSS